MSRRAWGQGIEPQLPMPRNATVIASSDPRMAEIFGVQPQVAGVAVTEQTAMRHSAAYACCRILGGAVASMPLDVFRREPDRRTKVNEKHDLWWLLNEEPHPRWPAAAAWKWLVKAELLRGDAFAFIHRDRAGRPVRLQPIVTAGVIVERHEDRLRYFWSDEDGKARGADQDDVLHFPGFGFDGIRGLSAIAWGARNGIGVGLATDQFTAKFFSDGAMLKHALLSGGRMDDAAINQLREQFAERYSGLGNAFKPLVLTNGITVKELSLSAEDAQLLDARRFQVEDVARAFGVPPFMVGAGDKTSTWGTGIEQMSLGFVKYTLQERLAGMEQELNRKLFRTAGFFVKFNADQLLRGDSQARAKFLRELVGGSQGPGIITRNEARGEEGYAPMEGGDALFDPRKAQAAASPRT